MFRCLKYIITFGFLLSLRLAIIHNNLFQLFYNIISSPNSISQYTILAMYSNRNFYVIGIVFYFVLGKIC